MALDDQPVENLQKIREKLVELRRARAEYGVNGDPENAADHIINVQAQIAAIDTAIADENKLRGPQYAGIVDKLSG